MLPQIALQIVWRQIVWPVCREVQVNVKLVRLRTSCGWEFVYVGSRIVWIASLAP